MDDERTERAKNLASIVHLGLLLGLVVLQDPEVRRNLLWAISWTTERLRARLSPDDDEPPAPDVSKVLSEARAITMDPKGPTIGKVGE
jgi:hypothetical protein